MFLPAVDASVRSPNQNVYVKLLRLKVIKDTVKAATPQSTGGAIEVPSWIQLDQEEPRAFHPGI